MKRGSQSMSAKDMSAKEEIVFRKMIGYCDDAMKYAAGLDFDTFIRNELYLTFSIFALSQLGELVNRLDKTIVQAYPGIPWNAMKGLRNHIVHDYEGIRLRSLWDTIQRDIPALKKQLEAILKEH